MTTENQDPKQPEKTEPEQGPKFMTAEDFNKAQSAREKRFREQMKKDLADMLAQFSPSKGKQTDTEESDEDDPAEASAKPAGQPSAPAQSDPTAAELKRLRKRLEASEKEREAERKAREEQAAKLARDEERTKLQDALVSAGVAPKRVRAAIALLHTEDRKVRRNQEGKIIFALDDDDEADLVSGVKQWLATDEGKDFLPPRGAEGSGERPTKQNHNKPVMDKRTEGVNALFAAVTGRKL
jgi:hypothetical protein